VPALLRSTTHRRSTFRRGPGRFVPTLKAVSATSKGQDKSPTSEISGPAALPRRRPSGSCPGRPRRCPHASRPDAQGERARRRGGVLRRRWRAELRSHPLPPARRERLPVRVRSNRAYGDDLRCDPLAVRKATLASVLAAPGLRLNTSRLTAPRVAHACKMGLEGIVSKRKDSAYRSGRSPDGSK
jgi:hypothetical protein